MSCLMQKHNTFYIDFKSVSLSRITRIFSHTMSRHGGGGSGDSAGHGSMGHGSSGGGRWGGGGSHGWNGAIGWRGNGGGGWGGDHGWNAGVMAGMAAVTVGMAARSGVLGCRALNGTSGDFHPP